MNPWQMNTVATVSFDEIAFATACFLAAAEGQMAGCSSGLSKSQGIHCRRVYTGLLKAEEGSYPSKAEYQAKRQLYDVFRSLWEHHIDQTQHSAICARVLAFHLLMERTAGAAIQGWTMALDGDESQLALHPAVVHAIGQVLLRPDHALSERVFREQILTCNHCEASPEAELHSRPLLSAYAH
jgi:hypothetical protein